MDRKTVIVTGGSKGIGRELSRLLCENDYDVIIACRDEERGRVVVENLNKGREQPVATFMQLDVSSKEAVQKFVDDFKGSERRLFALVNNAGVNLSGSHERQSSADGFELTVGTNYLGPFHLTHLLLDTLKTSAEVLGEARVINVTTQHVTNQRKQKKACPRELDVDNLMYHKLHTYSAQQAYSDSKTALVMHAYQLAEELRGSKVAVLAVYPGSVPSTDLARSSSLRNRISGSPLGRVVRHNKTPEQAAAALLDVVIGEKYKEISGKFISEGRLSDPCPEARDPQLRAQLWTLSGGLLQLEGFSVVQLPELEQPPPPAELPEKKKSQKKDKKAKEEEIVTEAADVTTNGEDTNEGEEGTGVSKDSVTENGEASKAEEKEETNEEVAENEQHGKMKENTESKEQSETPDEQHTAAADKSEEKINNEDVVEAMQNGTVQEDAQTSNHAEDTTQVSHVPEHSEAQNETREDSAQEHVQEAHPTENQVSEDSAKDNHVAEDTPDVIEAKKGAEEQRVAAQVEATE